MIRQIIFSVMILAAAGALPTDFATAQQPQVIHFQGLLTGPDGNPLRTDFYEVEFSIWEHATNEYEPLWSEIQMVETTDGLFDVFLGSADFPLSADVFVDEDDDGTYLQMQVVGDDPMTPRIQMGKTPTSFISSRVLGDIQTGAGSFKLTEPLDEMPAIEMTADGEAGIYNFKMIEPGDDGVTPAFEMSADLNGNSFHINRYDPDDAISRDAVSIDVDGINMITNFRLIEPGNDDRPGFEMTANGFANSATFRMMEPDDDSHSLFEMMGSPSGNSFKINWADVMEVPSPAIEMLADGGGSQFKVNLTEPVDRPGVEIFAGDGGVGGQVSIKMFNPQPEPPHDPLLEMSATQDGAGINLADDIGQYMGIEPSPFMPGGVFTMTDPSTESINVWLDSQGRVASLQGMFGYSITNIGNYNLSFGAYHNISGSYCFAGGSYAHVNHDDCFVWSDYSTTAPLETTTNNQFLIRSAGGTIFYSNNDMSTGVELTPGATSWSSIITAASMQNAREVDSREVLDKIKQLPIKRFTVNAENEPVEHISPMADEFNALFNTGKDSEHLSTLDPSGVALAGVKGLLEKIESLEARIAELEAERR